MGFEKIVVYIISCSTGCSCCCYDNHRRGLYKTKEDAERRIKYYNSKGSKFWPVASQYASRGRYSIGEYTAEILPDNRYILDGEVFATDISSTDGKFIFIDVAEDGTVENNESEWFDSD